MANSQSRRARLTAEALEAREVPAGFVTAVEPYLVPSSPGVSVKSLVTVGDSVNGYRMVGIPDGLGAFDNGDGTFTVLMNHELPANLGVPRAHGQAGAFASKWVIDKASLSVLSGSDLIQNVVNVTGTKTLGRLCSADLPSPFAFFNRISGLGTTERIFMHGEEVGAEGREFGTVVSTGTAFELPRLGKLSWENSLANPFPQDKTIVVGMDDSTPGQVYVYVGTKTAEGTPVDRAGLTNGVLYGIKVDGILDEARDASMGTRRFALAPLADVSAKTGAQIQADSEAAGVTEFLRPEDGAWNPRNPNEFYFVTTDRFDTPAQPGRSRLYKLTFDDVTSPEAGGRIDVMLDGTDPGQMYDNITINPQGQILLQEDPGNQTHIARIWQYDTLTGELTEVLRHNPKFFQPGSEFFLTQDEESSGIIDLSLILGPGYFAADVQSHRLMTDPELVEDGQFLILNTSAPTATVVDRVLTIEGTPSVDNIRIGRVGSAITVFEGFRELGRFRATDVSAIHVNAGAGNDTVALRQKVSTPAVVAAGTGDDLVIGNAGRNVLIGGAGTDILRGRGGQDLLIGGSTTFDDDPTQLLSILSTWVAPQLYAERVDGLRALLNPTSVVDDGAADYLLGLGGLDWFFAAAADVRDAGPSETVN